MMGFKLKRGKPYKVEKILLNICGSLEETSPQTPASIAKHLNIHPRTAEKYLNAGKELGMFECNEISMGKNKITLCNINPDYLEVLRKLKKR